MDDVPSNSVDVVVVTLVLCSVKDMEKFLAQVVRVLAPVSKIGFLNIRLKITAKNGTNALYIIL